MIFISCTLFGFVMKLKIESRLNNLKNIQLCTQIFESEIRYNMSDAIHIIQKASDVSNEANRKLFANILSDNHNNPNTPLSKIWVKVVNENYRDLEYTKKDREALAEFGNILGSGNVETQLKNIDVFRNKISDLIQESENKTLRDGSFYSKAGIYLGVIIVILLI